MTQSRIVVKVGTSTLTDGGTSLSLKRIFDLVRQISDLLKMGKQVVLVSSGAIRAGREALGFPILSALLPQKQMMAAIGQPRLMAIYEQFFKMFGVTTAQVLLNRSDFSNRISYLNARSTMTALLEHAVVPIVNENDTTAVDEIRIGDNDNLSAYTAALVEAEQLILLTDQPGLFTADPRLVPDAKMVREVNTNSIPYLLWQAAGGSRNDLGTGGMVTKLQAADTARRAGIPVVIASGSMPDILPRLCAGESLGTTFHAVGSILESRKRYILSQRKTRGRIGLDSGATRALIGGESILPIGITRIDGQFNRGDSVLFIDPRGETVAVGLVNYDSADLNKICKKHSRDIEGILGYTFGEEAAHRNNLVLLGGAE